MELAMACPDADTLERLLLGRVAGPDASTLEDHVSWCQDCAGRMASLPAEDELVAVMRLRSTVLGEVDREQVRELVERVRGSAHGPPGEIPGPFGGLDESQRVGPYRVRRELGRGGMGVVYEAEDTRLRRTVALKVLRDHRFADPRYRDRFVREADALARLAHPNIVRIYEVGEHEGRPYLALEYLAGGTLAAQLQGRPQPPRTAAGLAATLAGAVQYAHEQGVVHRDLKPSNILLQSPQSVVLSPQSADRRLRTEDDGLGTPRIADFGLARHHDDDGLTRTGDLLGTPGYMAPEATRGGTAGRDSPTVDIYSLGAILYELLTGRPPFRGETVPDTLEQVRTLDPVPPRRLQPKVPRDLETVALKCLEKEPRKRYASANELAADLARFLDGKPILARRAGPLERTWKWARRKPGWASVVAVSVAAVLVLVVGAVLYERRLLNERSAAKQSAADAQRERENARENYREARAALEKMLTRTRDPRRGDLPKIRELRRDQQEDALAFYLAVASREGESDPEQRWDAARARLEAGRLQSHLGRYPQARENLQLARELFASLAEESPDSKYRHGHAEAITELGYFSALAEARPLLEEALREEEALLAAEPTSETFLNALARICHLLGQKSDNAGDKPAAERYWTRAIETRRQLLKRHPEWSEERLTLAQTQVNLLVLRQQSAGIKELEPLVNEVGASLDELAMLDKTESEALATRAALRANWAYVLADHGRMAEAFAGLDRALEGLDAFLKREPDWETARLSAYSAHGTRAVLYDRQHKPREAAADYRRVVEFAPTAEARLAHRADLAALLISAGDLGASAEEVRAAAADPGPVPSIQTLRRHLANCATLSETGVWVIRPYRAAAVRAAVDLLDRTRRGSPPASWADWVRQLRSQINLAPLLSRPEVDAILH